MSTHTHPHRRSCYHGTEQDTGDHSDLQNWEDWRMYAMLHPAYATRTFEADTVSPSTASMLDTQNNLSTAETALDDGFAAPITDFNGNLDFFESSESMLPPTDPCVPQVNQLGEWDNLFPAMTFPSNLHVPLSAVSTYGRLSLNHVAMVEEPCFGTLENNNAYNTGPLASVNDDLLLIHADSYAIQSGDDYGHAMNHEFLENCMSDLQQGAQNPLPHIGLTTQRPLSSMPGPNIGLPLYDIGPSLSIGQDWVAELPTNEREDTLVSFPGYQSWNEASHVSNSSLKLGRPSLSTSRASDTIGSTTAIERPSKKRQIMPKSMNTAAGKAEIVGGKNASMQANKRAGRRGPFSVKKKEKVSDMRLRTACSSCSASHVECSQGDPCLRCVKHAKSPHLGIRCNRGSMRMYLECFSPPLIGGHLRQPAVEQFTNPLEFINNEIFVKLSTAPSHPPISLLVCEFIPPDEDFLFVPLPTPKSQDNMQSFANVRSLGWGVLKRNMDQLKPRCLEHIQTISNRDTVIGNPETLSWKIMRAICRFQQTDPIARKNDLLGKAIIVNRLHYVLGTNIYSSLDSIDQAVTRLQNVATDLPSLSQLSARVLTKQIKWAMNDLLIDFTTDLLNQYNGELRDKRPETWLLCLMTHLVLCLCAEQVQIQIDSFIVFQMPRGGCDLATLRKCGTEVCRRLENVVLEHSWDLIRGKLRTLLRKRNPFKYGYQVHEGDIPKETEVNLVNEIRQVMSEHEVEISKKGADPYSGGSSRTPEDASNFRDSNSSRLLSKFLRRLY